MLNSRNSGRLMAWPLLPLAVLAVFCQTAAAEYVKNFKIAEGVPPGSRIGFIGESEPGRPQPPGPPYLVVPSADSPIDEDLDIDQNTGEIRTNLVLDRENRHMYRLSAIPLSGDGENIKVTIEVTDVNDNSPTFSQPTFLVELPENSPKDSRRRLPTAVDADLGIFNTQRYDIIQGNTRNRFRLSTQRDKDGSLMLDLIVNGFLDRESIANYSLVIQAQDGGNPPKKGILTVEVNILDLNDNAPIFQEQRYYATVAENVTVGTKIITVKAVDPDQGVNGEVRYSINRRQSDIQELFAIDSLSGLLSVNKRLDFETRENHELVVVAKDNGLVPQETTAFITVKITDINDNQPTINIKYRTPTGRPEIYEDTGVGRKIADIDVSDPDEPSQSTPVSVTLSGQGSDHFALERGEGPGWGLLLAKPVDRETKEQFSLRLEALDEGFPPLRATQDLQIRILDVNDNDPVFEKTSYEISIPEAIEIGSSVLQARAKDADLGENSRLTYRIENRAQSHSDWFDIEPTTGLIVTRTQIDCETDPDPLVVVVATDNGNPRRSGTTTIHIGVEDVNDNEPRFDQTFYNVSLRETEDAGRCFVRVHAKDTDCGVSSKVAYKLADSQEAELFKVDSTTGDICLESRLDYERATAHHLTVVAVDRGGLSSTSMVRITVEDENDNYPQFSPQEYKATVLSTERVGSEIVRLSATDKDSGIWGDVQYSIAGGNKEGIFSVGEGTGIVTVAQTLTDTRGLFELSVTAVDGGGNRAKRPAKLQVMIEPRDTTNPSLPPACSSRLYQFSVRENVPLRSRVGRVETSAGGGVRNPPRLFIYPATTDLFAIDPTDGVITTRGRLDHEMTDKYLLNVGVESDDSSMVGYCQVAVSILDVNDNAPSFGSTLGLVTISEAAPADSLVFAKTASDPDSGLNGAVMYRILREQNTFSIDQRTGVVRTNHQLDYEQASEHSLQIVAYDQGTPSLSTSLSLNILVQDENDHTPQFPQKIYKISVDENLPKDSQILPLAATDEDSGKNGRLKYTIIDGSAEDLEYLSILPSSGILFIKKELDFEAVQKINIRVKVEDEGSPSLSDECSVEVSVVDVNDNYPKFSTDTYRFSVLENTGPDYPIGDVDALDADSGANGQLTYRIKSSSDAFKINKNTGQILSVLSLDREKTDEYMLEVEAVDQGQPRLTSTATVHVQVLDENDNAPMVVSPVSSVLMVRAGARVGTTLAVIRALDTDTGRGGEVVVEIEDDGGRGYDLFTVEAGTGVLRTAAVLEETSEDKQNVTLTILVRDRGSPSLSNRVRYTVMILRENDQVLPTSQTNLLFKVSGDGLVGGSRIGSVAPRDSNLDLSGAWFSIVAGNRDNLFDIEGESGELVLTRPLAGGNKEFNLRVALNDNVYGMAREIIEVRIVNSEDEGRGGGGRVPLLGGGGSLEIKVAENTAIGTPIHAIINPKAGADNAGRRNGSISYTLLNQYPDNFFRIDTLSGALFLVKELDYETTEKVFMTLRATAADSLKTSNVAVIVDVEDVNDHAPTFVSATTKEIQQETDIGVPFHRVMAVDADSGEAGTIRYDIEGGDADSIFQLDAFTGLLSVKERPRRSTYRLSIRATDNGSPRKSATEVLTITVVAEMNGPPKFTQSVYRAEVMEHSRPGAHVSTVQADKKGTTTDVLFSLDDRVSMGLFGIDERSGEIVTKGDLDREARDEYIITVYVHDDANTQQPSFDTATVLVKVLDMNDNAPRFEDSCYSLFVPENTDLSALHKFIAVDADEGANGDITYSIVGGGNYKNRFSVDAHSGQLSAPPLDHEERAAYKLSIQAEDQGSPRRSVTCEMTVRVVDRNDNDPVFAETKYRARIKENVGVGTKVLSVTATDADSGQNAKISYSIQNGTGWIFGIDKDSGEIYTTGRLDREKNEEYNLLIVAVDEGVEDTRMASTTVSIVLDDVNDNKPEFVEYPFMARILPQHQVGSQIIRVNARDRDRGQNANLRYSFLNRDNIDKFEIDAVTGIISARQSLEPDDGRMFHIEILVTDGGSPSLSSTGLVEIRVGQQPSVQLNFQQKVYTSEISEDSKVGEDIGLQVSAVRSDGRIQRVIYTFGQGNEEGTFEINSNNGLIRLKNPASLDYETRQEFRFTVIGHAAGQDQLYAYAKCVVRVRDINDNEPRFTQSVYFARAWEGNNKGTFVTQVMAVDGDSIENDRLYYQIVDGNHDGAFSIDQQYSGIIKTNIVLDREIREEYELTVTATDGGSPPNTGYTRVSVKIIDINDNQPQFPRTSPITLSEGTLPGTRIGTIQANDIDSHPQLVYSFKDPVHSVFSIDKFSGVLSLAAPIDREQVDSYSLVISASDGAHTAETRVEVEVTDVNDSAPRFSQQVYTGVFSSNMTLPASVLTVSAVDADIGANGEVKYALVGGGSDIGYVDTNGTVVVNNTGGGDIQQGTEIHLVVSAEDFGSPRRQTSYASVRLQNLQHSATSPQFHQPEFDVIIESGAKIGTRLANIEVPYSGGNLFYSLEAGSANPYIGLDSSSGALVLKKRIDDPKLIPKSLGVTLRRDNRLGDEASAKIRLNLDSFAAAANNFNGGHLFARKYYDVNLSENTDAGDQPIFRVPIPPSDDGPTQYNLKIAAGNLNDTFKLTPAGSLLLNKPLDYETTAAYRLTILATRNHQFDTLTVAVRVRDENDNAPFFPVRRQIHSIKENAPPGSLVFVAYARDLDTSDSLTYSITSDEFSIGETNGRVVSKRSFDYETEQAFSFILNVRDSAGATASADITVRIESVDEYQPAFESPSYKFPVDRLYPAGHSLGRVKATDADAGPGGRLVYSPVSVNRYFKVDADTGEVYVAQNLDTGVLDQAAAVGSNPFQDVTYTVQASTGREPSLKTQTLVIFQVKTDVLPPAPLPSTSGGAGLAAWVQALIIAFIFIIIIVGAGVFFFKRFSVNEFIQKRLIEPNSPAGAASMPYMHDTSTLDSTVPMSQYPPPQYSDIVSQYGHSHGKSGQARPGRLTQSELSEQSHRSASSGRGSAEDNEEEVDHEIQMINGASLPGLPGLNDTCLAEDSRSDISVQNGKEYLARLGIDTTRAPHLSLASSYQTLDPGQQDLYNRLQDTDAMSEKNSLVSGNNSVYARTGHPVSMTGSLSSIVHEEEVAGSYNWDYLLDWGPQYQPLQHVFQEISSLKDEGPMGGGGGGGGLEGPPLLTSLPPRHAHTLHPRSPVSQEMLAGSALSPSFTPALSPLAARSPSISPLGAGSGGGGPVVRGVTRATPHRYQPSSSLHSEYVDAENELRI